MALTIETHRTKLEQKFGLVGHPKAALLYMIAYDLGRAGGFGVVEYYYQEMSNLLDIWFKPKEIETSTQYHSTSNQIIPLLLVIKGREYPVEGWYDISIADRRRWRINAEPSICKPIAWRPMPSMPEEEVK